MVGIEKIKEEGLRLTTSRKELLEIFENNPDKHFLFEDIVNEMPNKVNIATLYNNIATFLELKIIKEIYIAEKKYYEYNHKIHAHFRCLKCDSFYNIQINEIAALEDEVTKQNDCEIEKVDISFSGKCSKCLAKENYEIVNVNEYPIKEFDIEDYIEYLLVRTKINKKFTLVLINDEDMQNLNNEFRQKDYVTDVLTFCEPGDYLGDVLICYSKIFEQAQKYGNSDKREFLFLITHGFLHLLGYDHQNEKDEKEMFALQRKLLKEYGEKNE